VYRYRHCCYTSSGTQQDSPEAVPLRDWPEDITTGFSNHTYPRNAGLKKLHELLDEGELESGILAGIAGTMISEGSSQLDPSSQRKI
jgi:hypothetical protein